VLDAAGRILSMRGMGLARRKRTVPGLTD